MNLPASTTNAFDEIRDAFGSLAHVVGVARGKNNSITIMLDEDDAAVKNEVANWARSRATKVEFRVVGIILAV